MNIKQLQYFIAVVREGSFSAAAKSLGISQPPLSSQIKLLEEELAVELLERGCRPVRSGPAPSPTWPAPPLRSCEAAAAEKKPCAWAPSLPPPPLCWRTACPVLPPPTPMSAFPWLRATPTS